MGRPNNDPVNEMGRRIRERREELGLDQEKAGVKCGLAGATFSYIETGKRPNPGIYTVAKIARGLGLTLDDLVQPS